MANLLLYITATLLACITLANALAQSGMQYCWTDPTSNLPQIKFVVTSNDETINTVFSYQDSTCALTSYSGGIFEIIFNPATQCGAISDGAGGYSIQFRTRSLPGVYVSTDTTYNVTCLASNLTALASEGTNADIVGVSDPVSENSLTGSVETPMLNVIQVNGNGIWEFGEQVYLRVKLTSDNVVKGVKIVDCFAAPTSAFISNSTIQLIQTGCSVISTGIFNPSQNNTGFTEDTNRTEPFAVVSEQFSLFKFMTQNTINLKCTYEYCYTSAANCFTSCATSSRKKRSSHDEEHPENGEVFARINFNDHTENPSTIVRTIFRDSMPIYRTDCTDPLVFVTAIAVLTVLLILALGVSVFALFKVRRSVPRHSPIDSQNKMGFENPGY